MTTTTGGSVTAPKCPPAHPGVLLCCFGPCSAHGCTGMLTPSQFPVWAPSVFLECEKPCPVQGAQNTLARAPRQRHTDFEACALHMITGVGRTAAVDGPCLASRAHERAPAVCPSPRERDPTRMLVVRGSKRCFAYCKGVSSRICTIARHFTEDSTQDQGGLYTCIKRIFPQVFLSGKRLFEIDRI